MASLKSAVTWARLHVASDESEGDRGRKGYACFGLCACSFAALVILIFLLFFSCFNILYHFTSGSLMRQRPKERCSVWGGPLWCHMRVYECMWMCVCEIKRLLTYMMLILGEMPKNCQLLTCDIWLLFFFNKRNHWPWFNLKCLWIRESINCPKACINPTGRYM